MRQAKDRINGPYQHGNQWRVLVATADGARGYRYFATEAEGKAYVREARCAIEGRTVGATVREYLEYLRTYGGPRRSAPLRESTVRTIEYRLLAFFRLREADMPMTELSEKVCASLYERRTRTVRVDTHRGELVTAQQFLAWAVEHRKGIVSNPSEGIRPRGELSTGKEILTTDEGRVFLRAALADGSDDGLACAVVLLLALRASELAALKCRDLDAGGTVIRVTAGKTARAIRNILVPDILRARLASLRGARPEGDQLFSGMTRYRLHYQVGRICSVAGVRRVCPHGLRGSAITEAATAGLTVAQRLAGHEIGTRVTERHYIAPGTLESARAASAAEYLGELVDSYRGNDLGTEPADSFPRLESDGEAPLN